MTYKERRDFIKSDGKIELSQSQKIGLCLIGLFFLFMLVKCNEQLTPEEQAKKDKENLISGARAACRVAIDNNLSDPDSAIYGSDPLDNITIEKKPGVWFVQRKLSARNAFNARIKATYTCLLNHNGKEFHVIKLKRG